MKKIKKKLKKGEYVQMPLSEFVQRFPEIAEDSEMDLEELANDDDRYVIRFGIGYNGSPVFELGFESDRWFMFE